MKDLEFSGSISLNTLSVDTLNTVGLNDMGFNINTLGEMLRLEVGGTVRVPNNRSFISQNIFTDIIKPLTFSNDVVFNGGNSTNDAYEEYVRLDASAEKVSISKETKFEDDIQLNVGQVIKFSNVFIRGVQGTTRPEFDLIINGSTSHMRMWVAGAIRQAITNTAIACKVNIDAEQGITVFNGKELKTNTINSNGNNDLVISRYNIPFLTLDKFTEDTVEKEAIICSKQLRANGQFRINNLQINQITTGVDNYADVRLEDNKSRMRFFVGDANNVNLQIIKTDTLNEILLNRNTKCSETFYTNEIDTYSDTDLVFSRNATEALRIRASDNLILTSDTSYFSSPKVYSNEYLNRTSTYDTVFYGTNSTSDGRVEYMRWNRTEQSSDFNAPIDNTGIAITGNIIDTTVSDERLKTNIEDVDTDFTSCIKNVKVKTFKYKDDKYKTNDTYGFIAQEMKEHLPKECKNIVKENKV